MDEAPKKANPSLSIDRAAFLLLRVKKAFKRKRQQRKDRLAAQQAAASVASQTRSTRKGPPPLLRSRTLPAIVVPGISILHAQIEPNRLTTGESTSSFNTRWSLHPKSSRSSLANDDSSLEYRRKSSGSTHSGTMINFNTTTNNNNGTEPYIYACDDYERHADGTVVLRIPAPHVVAARAYRVSVSSGSGGGGCSSSTSASSAGIFNIPIPAMSSPSGAGIGCSSSSSSSGAGGLLSAAGSSAGIGCSTNTNSGGAGSSSNNNSGSGTNTALYRLARLLNQTTKSGLGGSGTSGGGAGGGGGSNYSAGGRQSPTYQDDAPRRLSWERRVSKLPRSSSIDSMVEAVWNDTPRPSLTVPREPTGLTLKPLPLTTCSTYFHNNNNLSISNTSSNCNNNTAINMNNNQPNTQPTTSSGIGFTPVQQPSQLSINYGNFGGSFRRESLLSPSANRRTKQNRGIVEIALPDLITRTSTQPIPPPPPPQLPSANSAPSTKTKPKFCSSSIVNEIQKNFRLKSPLFGKQKPKSLPILLSTTTTLATENNNMDFLVPSTTTTSTTQQCQQPENNNNDNNNDSQKQQQQSVGRSHHLPNGKLFFNTNGFHILSSSNHHNNHQHNHHHHNHQHNHPPIKKHLAQNLPSAIVQSILQRPQIITDAAAHQPMQQENQNGHTNCLENNATVSVTATDNNNIYKNDVLQQQQQLLITQPQSNFNIQTNQKMTKKQLKLAKAQLDKTTIMKVHLYDALFSAVEHSHLEKARTILESSDVDVNSLNSDGLSPLDVAVLTNNRSMTKMLLQHGAIEGTQFKIHDSLGNHLNSLLHDAEKHIQDLSGADDLPQPPFSTRASFSSIIGNSGPSVTGCTGTEADKQLGIWERRVKGLRRMLLGWDQARPPDYPSAMTVDVAGPNSVSVCILEPMEGPISTKFKVQWSTRVDFSNIVGEREIIEWTSYQGIMGGTCRITDLTQGRRYFFRSSCGNVKGWGPFKNSVPSSVIPSSWRDIDNRENRFAGRQRILDDLFTAVRLARPGDASELTLDKNIGIQRRNPKKKTTIKQLFSAASKFQKNLRRGIYLACILYYEDKILVTNEDFIPVIEIDETYPSSLHNDYYWLMKVACTWDDVKSLRTDMERNSTSAVHFRTKLLSSACQMQSALCITDLGQLYHKPLRDSHGTVVLSCVNAVKSPKSISVLNSRWVPLNKIQKKVTALHEDNNINEILINSIAEQINYHQTSSIRLTRGLYLSYLKMQCSVDQIQIVVPAKTPNVLPHCKIRENPHISAEEWAVLKGEKSNLLTPALYFRPKSDGKSEVQKLFLEALTTAVSRLFTYMNISPDDALVHRLYDIEVIELSNDVSFLVVCPRVESSCAVPGQREILLQRGDLLSLPIQAFEMVHLRTYQNSIIQKYSRLSCILELDTALANHSHREAFSSSELQTAKERLAKLQELSASLNAVWKGVRWLMDVIGYARDRNCVPSITMKEILEYNRCESFQEDIDDSANLHLLQLPQRDNKLMKSSPGRGSWPGPAASNNLGNSSCYMGADHSKSEQNLGLSALTPGYLSINSGITDSSSRKNSADSQSGHSYFSAGEGNGDHIMSRLPPSRSEDTLVISKRTITGQQHRKRATSSVTNNMPSASSSAVTPNPHIIATAAYQATTDSMQSLSSDSESASYPLSFRAKDKAKGDTTKEVTFLKPTLTALQTEIKYLKEPLHISEPSSPCTERPIRPNTTTNRHSDDDDDLTKSSSSPVASTSSGAASSSGTPQPGIIQVYAAYATGLASGTSLKLHVTPKTSAREVVDLVVKQLNMAVVLKGKDGPIYTGEKLENFCLVAVIGARERCLRDDFKPLQLQNPWKKGRLYVRQKHDLLAAIEHSNRETHLI